MAEPAEADMLAAVPRGLAYAALFVTLTYFTSFSKWNPVNSFLEGLQAYWLVPESQLQQQEKVEGSKAKKRMEAMLKKLSKSNNRYLMPGPLSRSVLDRMEFIEDFQHLFQVMAAASVVVVLVSGINLTYNLGDITLVTVFVMVVAGYVLFLAAKSEWQHDIVDRAERRYMILFAMGAMVASYGALVYTPPAWRPFQLEQAAQVFPTTLQALFDRQWQGTEQLPQEIISTVELFGPSILAAFLSLLAGALSALFMGPGLRYGRLSQQLIQAPCWCQALQASGPVVAMAAAHYLIPLALVLLWLPPMSQVLLVPAPWLPLLRWCLMVAEVVLSVALLSQMVQAWLNQAFLHWYLFKHMARRDVNEEHRMDLMASSNRMNLAQTARVALQLSFMPCCMCCGLLLWTLKCFPTLVQSLLPAQSGASAASSSSSSSSSSGTSDASRAFYDVLSGFVVWWGCLAWSAYATLGMVFMRARAASPAQK